MATPSPADSPAAPAAPLPPARDQREEFIPPSLVSGQGDAPSISSLQIGAAPSAGELRLPGSETLAAPVLSRSLPGSGTGDIILLLGVIGVVLGFLLWRAVRSTVRENFAGQDHNKD